MNNKGKSGTRFFYWILVAILVFLIIFSFTGTSSYGKRTYFNEVVEHFENNEIESWYVVGNSKIIFKLTDVAGSKVGENEFPKKADFYIAFNSQEYSVLLENENYKALYYGSEQPTGSIIDYIYPILMIGLGIAIIYFMYRMFSGKGNGALSFGKSRARAVGGIKVRFADIAGAEEEKEELREIVEFLKQPSKFTELGARIPKGVLLVGPPGTGKTLLARAVAGESDVPFLSISGSDFVEMYVGVGAARVRDLFEQAKRNSPCIIFIDEIDAVGRQRGAGLGGSNDEREQTLNQMLVELDGFEANTGIIVLAATNRADVLDPALLRPGRFDRQVYVHPPDVKGREGIIRIHAKNKPIDDEVDFQTLARITSGFTGADLENMLNEAAILAARGNRPKILMQDITEGINKVIMGPQKKSSLVTERDRKITAYHESGHAILAKKLKHTEEVQEVSIIPRGMAGGYTMSRPINDDKYLTYNKLNDTIAELMGGRIAEELIFKDVTTGASNDIQRASEIARKMITEWGMSKHLGFVSFGTDNEVFIGRDYQHRALYSEKMAADIDAEIQDILDKNYQRAKKILTENKSLLDEMASLLLEKETIYKEEVDMLLDGKKVKDIISQMEEKEKVRKEKAEKSRREKEVQGKLRELEMKVKTSEVFLKHGILSQEEHDALVKQLNDFKSNINNFSEVVENDINSENATSQKSNNLEKKSKTTNKGKSKEKLSNVKEENVEEHQKDHQENNNADVLDKNINLLKDNIKSTDEKFIDNSIKSNKSDVNNIQNNHSPNNKSKKGVDDVKVRKSNNQKSNNQKSNNQKSKTLNENTKTKVNSKNSTDEGVNE